MPPKKFWYVGAMPAANGRVHPDVFQSIQHLAEGKPYGGYVAVFGPYSSKAEANAGKSLTAGLRGNRRNPVRADARTYARLEHAASLPHPSKSDLEALSDDELNTFADAYDRALISLKGDIEEEETPSGHDDDKEYLAAARSVYAGLKRYFTDTVVPLDNARHARQQKAFQAEQEALRQKRQDAKLRTAERKAAKAAADEAARGIITAERSSTRYYLGDEVSGPKGWYEVTAIGDSDTHTLKAALAAGIPDKRVHSGAWILLEESDVQGPSRDALIVSIGKGVKLNPRRRR